MRLASRLHPASLVSFSPKGEAVMAAKPRQLATPFDLYLVRNAKVFLPSAHAMQAGSFTLPANAKGLTREALKAAGTQLVIETNFALARVAVDTALATVTASGYLGGRPTRAEEIAAAFNNTPEATRLNLLGKSKNALYAHLKRRIEKDTGRSKGLSIPTMERVLRDLIRALKKNAS